jgi:two-component system CheB/CheR fusion protein
VVLFTNHNVMRDPPFSHQDLIACRNVLIYLQRPIQDRVFDIFHYSLDPGGYLFLGSSESAEHLPDVFDTIDKNHRIYQAKPRVGERPPIPSMPLHEPRGSHAQEVPARNRPALARLLEEPVMLEEQHQRAIETYGPPSVIVNGQYKILHVSESAGRYLHQPKGPITGDLLTLVRPELQMELRTSLFNAFEKSKAAVSRPVNVQFNGHRRRVVVSVRPRPDESGLDGITERQALVLFIEDEVLNPDELTTEIDAPRSQAERDQMIAPLQAEIRRLREQLQITIEEYDSSNEEMKAANEELQSVNEEYRSATEELETSKEELQSVNEELQTVNSEMRSKLDEISRAHQELENLMGATEIATLFLDREMRIQRFSAGVQELFSMLQIDQGRRVSDLTHKLGYSEFVEDAERALRKLTPVEKEIQTPAGMWFLIRLRPYRTVEDRIEGVVITFIDINKLKKTEQELISAKVSLETRVRERTRELDEANQRIVQAHDMFHALFHANPIPTALTRQEDGVILNANVEFLTYFGLEREEVIGKSIRDLNIGLETQERPKLVTLARGQGKVQSYETVAYVPSGEKRNIITSIQYVNIDSTDALISVFIDITDRVRAEQQIRSLASELTATEQAERHRLSQILHDDLQQRIFAIQMQMSFLKDAYEANDLQAFAVDFPQLETWLAEAIQVTRQLSVDLSPPILHGEGLVEAILWLAAQMQEQYGLEVNIRPEGTPAPVDEKVRILVFYAVRELLFNVVKHAGTLKAAVDFKSYDDYFHVVVSDQGKGFDPAQVLSNLKIAHGLLLIRHRLNLLGCAMDVKSQPGKGTRIIIQVPHGPEDI